MPRQSLSTNPDLRVYESIPGQENMQKNSWILISTFCYSQRNFKNLWVLSASLYLSAPKCVLCLSQNARGGKSGGLRAKHSPHNSTKCALLFPHLALLTSKKTPTCLHTDTYTSLDSWAVLFHNSLHAPKRGVVTPLRLVGEPRCLQPKQG